MATVAALFKDLDAARSAAAELSAIGISGDDISIVSNQSGHLTTDIDPIESTATGSGVGAIGGGAVGLVAGLALIPVSGLGIVGVLGWLATSLAAASAGLVAGATVASLYDVLRTGGTAEEEAHFFTEGLRAGGALVAVKTADRAEEVREFLRSSGGALTLPPAASA